MNKRGKILAAVAAGFAAGALLGVLFAPGKGSETRKKVKEKGKKFADEMQNKFNEGKEKFNDLREEMEKKAREKAEKFA
ncbi:MAG TPA: YtxH domain-containing protein [Ferruginibacter sp.]|jgi:gas vesicle protein|nr:YtxH domain-containing protein [Ferruginibacter sp.]